MPPRRTEHGLESHRLLRRLNQRLDAWHRAYGLRRPVRIAGSETLAAPVAAGLRDPMILVPIALLDHLTEEEFDQVMLHEWAHLHRWDDWTNLLQRFFEAVLFFHPAVLWIGRQMDRERELACDDWVVARTRRPRSYANCLTRSNSYAVSCGSLDPRPWPRLSPQACVTR